MYTSSLEPSNAGSKSSDPTARLSIREPGQRAAFLKEGCTGDEDLRREVESLLAHQPQAESSIETPVLEEGAKAMFENQGQSLVGRQFGPYKILSPLGAGGMGEVYKAHDSRLDRIDALKILPLEFASDRERMQRFVREARAASALKHPNVATIHELGEFDGLHFIAMEYVEGETLAARISGHPFPSPGLRPPSPLGRGAGGEEEQGRPLEAAEILEIGAQVADALDEAHSKGITHRDIKPGNIMLTKRGQVKVLDFGLAKVARPEAAAGSSDLSTLVKTETGVVMGTVQYMSPEQVLGQEVDHRSDIFSLGVVLYEMTTGRLPFTGTSTSETMDRILHGQPEAMARFNYSLPAELERITRKCLEKDLTLRYQTAADLCTDLRRLKRDMDPGRSAAAPRAQLAHRWNLIWVPALLVLLAAAAVVVWFYHSNSEVPEEPLAPVPLTSYPGNEGQASFSPDGNQVAFVWDGEKQDNDDIYIKLIGSEPPLRLTTHPAADSNPAWSPDGRWIAFLRELSAQKAAVLLVPVLGGAERKVTEIELPVWSNIGNAVTQGLAWTPDGKRLVLPDRNSSGQGLFLLSVETGEKQRLTSPPAKWLDQHPAVAPDGSTLAFVRLNSSGFGNIYLQRLGETLKPNGEPKRFTFDNRRTLGPAWTADGREIIFASGGTNGMSLWRTRASGPGKPQRLTSGGLAYELDSEPVLARQGRRLAYTQALWDFQVRRVGAAGPPGKGGPPTTFLYSTRGDANAYFSPDGKKIAFSSGRSSHSESYEIWVCDKDGSGAVQLTSLGAQCNDPTWSPDGERIAFSSTAEGQSEVYLIAANGGRPQRLTDNQAYDGFPSWSRDGKWIYFSSDRSGEGQIWKMPASGGEAVQVTRKGGFKAFESPDGKSVYYTKTDMGSSLWKVPVEGGEETKVLELVLANAFTVGAEGIHFMSKPPSEVDYLIQFYSLATGKIKPVATIPTPLAPAGNPFIWGLTASPDGQWFLYSQGNLLGSDLMLVENFH